MREFREFYALNIIRNTISFTTIKLVSLLASLALLLSLSVGVDQASAKTKDGLPTQVTELERSGWSSWIGNRNGSDLLEEDTKYCGDQTLIGIAARTAQHGVSNHVVSESAVGGITMVCGEGGQHFTPEYYGKGIFTTSTLGFNTVGNGAGEVHESESAHSCNDNSVGGLYFTVGHEVLGISDPVQGLGVICHDGSGSYEYEDEIIGFYPTSESKTIGVACNPLHQIQALQYSILSTEDSGSVYPIIAGVRVKCG